MPALGPSFGTAPAGTWTWTSWVANQSSSRPALPAQPGERGQGGLAHHVAELTRDGQLALARHGGRLDEQDVAARRRPRQACRDPRPARAPPCLRDEPRAPEQLAHAGRRHRHLARERALGHAARDLAARGADLALQVADARLARALGDDRLQAGVGERDLRALQAAALDLARHQVALGDLELLLLGVAGERDDLHAVAQRPRHGVERVGRGDEHDLREVERHVEVVVAERRVLLGVQHLQQRGGGIAAVVGAHLVDLVDHEQRARGAGVAQRADDRAGHRADVRAAVPADLGLVADAARADALELAAQRAGDRLPQRRLADPGRADEAHDRAARVRLEPPYGEELEDAVLDRLDVVVVGVEHLAGVVEVEVVLGRLVPRQRRDPLQVRADHAVLGRGLRQLLQPRQLAVDLAPDVLGQGDRGELLAQLLDLRLRGIALAELLLDRLELLAQDVLALRAVQLGLHLRLDARPDRGDLLLARQDLGEPAQPLGHVALLEQVLLLLGLEPQRARDEVRQRRGIVEVGDRELQLLRQVRDVLDDARERLLHVAHERRELRPLVHDVRLGDDARDEVGLLGLELLDPHARAGLDEDAQRAVGHLHHPRDRADHADAIQLVRSRRVGLRGAAGDHDEHPVAAQHVVDQPDRALLPHRQRGQGVRERDRVAERQHRQPLGQLGRGAEGDLLAADAGGGDLDHDSPSACRTGTVREPAGATIGSSTVSTPSSYVAFAASASTSAPSPITRRNGPCWISSCW